MKRVFLFGETEPDKALLGGKGASLATMTQLGLPVPPGFTITTSTCMEYLRNNNTFPDGLWDEVLQSMKAIEEKMGRKFGDPEIPLLVSVRSGAKISMPGMMDTVLNVGLTQNMLKPFGERINNPKFVKDSFRRLVFMFADVVCGLDTEPFSEIIEREKKETGAEFDYQLSESSLDKIIDQFLELFEVKFGEPFPSDPYRQLELAIHAVFKSWNNKRAINYRRFEGIPDDIGTAVNVQAMAFGNLDDRSGTGVLFTRNPATGADEIYGEFLLQAQGEDVVAGIRTPSPIKELQRLMPEIYEQLNTVAKKLENHYRDMQDIEFTIESGKLFILQTRAGKRTGTAAAKIAVDFVKEGLIDQKEAVMRVSPRDVESSMFPSVVWENPKKHLYYDIPDFEKKIHKMPLNEVVKDAPIKKATVIGSGLPAGPGAAAGHIIFDSDLAESIAKGETQPSFKVKVWRESGGQKIPSLMLVKKETSPEDFHGMVASAGIITMTGGLTSHAALVGRQIGKRVIVGASNSGIDLLGKKLRTKSGLVLNEGDVISMEVFDKAEIFKEILPIYTPTELPKEILTVLDWADEIAKIKVRANADKEKDALTAREFKAQGIGLARTEHQFFDALDLVQEMILAESKEERLKALDQMISLQRADFAKLFRVLHGLPVTIRLLDPPLHEFLPKELEIRERIWQQILNPEQSARNIKILRKVLYYQEANPMLGLRGCRLGLLFPEITEMQTRAIIEAALMVKKEGIEVFPEIMIPLVGFKEEFRLSREIVDQTAQTVFKEMNDSVAYKVGTMIEIPRAALTADEIAEGELGADFFSFGTNDLHQMTLGFSRDDVGKFLPFYLEEGIIKNDPFQTIDVTGVGKLMDMCVSLGRTTSELAGKYLKVGICGEQGGDPASIDFCYRIGLDYVSCSPYRVPVARLAAAQATLKNPEPDKKFRKQIE